MSDRQHTSDYCICGKSQSARRQDGGLYCKTCGKDYHPDNFEAPISKNRTLEDAERSSAYWKAEHAAAIAENQELRAVLFEAQQAVLREGLEVERLKKIIDDATHGYLPQRDALDTRGQP